MKVMFERPFQNVRRNVNNVIDARLASFEPGLFDDCIKGW